jgi:Glycosyl hydrolases family 28
MSRLSQNPSANQEIISRRKWLGLVSTPALAASLGGLAEQSALAAEGADKSFLQQNSEGTGVHNIRNYGAKGDGKTPDTAAVQAAIDACEKDRGGIVLVPAGDFVVGTIELKSNVTLHLSAAGRLLGSDKIEHYSPGKGVPPGNGNVVLLYAVNAENVSIEGKGTVDGQGAKFYTGKGDNTGPGQNREQGYVNRPHLAIFYRCKNLSVQDAFLTASAYHCMRILECTRVQLQGVRIHNRVNKNNDGFHLVSNQYVHIANCDIACQDDACALFGSNKFVTVTNCSFSTRWSVFRFGGGKSENITVSNCVIYETYGCPIKMRFGSGSGIENAIFSNLVMSNVTGPISIGLDSTSRRSSASADGTRPKAYVRNLVFSGIRATVVAEGRQHADLPFPSSYRPGETRSCIVLNGAGEDFLEGISLSDIQLTFEGGGTTEEAARRDVPKMAGEYFELGVLPAYGLYARNVRGLTLHNIRFEVTKPDLRPAVVFENVEDAGVNGLSAQGNPKAQGLLRLTDARDVYLSGCRVLTPTAAFVHTEGASSRGITIDGGDVAKAATIASFGNGASKEAVKVRVS